MAGRSTPEPIKLSDQHVAALRRSLARAEAAVPVWDTLQECGVDCQERRQILEEARRQALLLLERHGPPPQGQRD